MRLMPPAPLVKGVLSPVERYSEVLFGVLMALTMTGTPAWKVQLHVHTQERQDPAGFMTLSSMFAA